jgi:Leucine-rich repeat (LRR) protein
MLKTKRRGVIDSSNPFLIIVAGRLPTHHQRTTMGTESSEEENTSSDPAPPSESNAAAGEASNTRKTTVVTMPELPVGWTQLGAADHAAELPVRYPTDVAEISKDDLELCIVGTAGQKITFMGNDLDRSLHPELVQLVLRSHLIRKMDGIKGLTKLELLELYDNQIEELGCLADGPNGAPGATLRVLDMSYNVIRAMDPVASCPNLQELCTYIYICICFHQKKNMRIILTFVLFFFFALCCCCLVLLLFVWLDYLRLGQQQDQEFGGLGRFDASAQTRFGRESDPGNER